ncbi:MAG: hypothetical protein GEV11_00980 [Streptosporangiales bacterium]|nr:hypothetical protein [Streptosporangiales bacterium]
MGMLGDALRRMRHRPQAAGVAPPVVLAGIEAGFSTERADGAAMLAAGLAESARRSPYAHLQSRDRVARNPYGEHVRPEVAATAELLREASREISLHHARGEPPIRFPLISLLLRLLEIGPQDERTLRRRLWQKSEVIPGTKTGDERGPSEPARVAGWLTYGEVIVPPAVTLLALVSATVAQVVDLTWALLIAGLGVALTLVQLLAASRDWAGRWRFRWFTRQRFVATAEGDRRRFLDIAALFVRRSEEEDHADDVERLLVHAFLEDLRRAYRRRWYRRAPWARVIHPLLVVAVDGPDDPGYLLVRRIDEVRRVTRVIDPLLVVVVGAEAPPRLPLFPPEDPATDLETATGLLDGWSHAGRTAERFGARRDVVVTLTPDQAEAEAATGDLPAPPRRPRLAHPALPWAVSLAVVLGSGAFVASEQLRYCHARDVWRSPEGECVGVTDGAFAFHERLESVTQAIKDENERVEASRRPAITVVYFGPMTPSGGISQPDLLAGVHGELAGVAAQQRGHNDSADLPKVKLLLASPGSRSRYAVRVTGQVIRMAHQDPSIVGVVGFGQSTGNVRAAIRSMGAAGLPMVGTVSTFERLSETDPGRLSPYFFRLAPGNSRLAGHAARWAYEGRLARPGEAAAPPARSALVFSDGRTDDLYSRDLGERFSESFDERPGTTVTQQAYLDTSDFREQLNSRCTPTGDRTPDVIYYAGRSDEFLSFFRALDGSTCRKTTFTLLAGDDVTKYVNDNRERLAAGDIRFFYTPLALPPQGPLDDFEYRELLEETGLAKLETRMQPSRTHAALGHDALAAMTAAAMTTYRQQNRTLPRGGALLYPLSRLTDAFGVSGYIAFAAGPDGGHATVDKAVLLVTVARDRQLRLVEYCGRLTQEDTQDDGPGDRCRRP